MRYGTSSAPDTSDDDQADDTNGDVRHGADPVERDSPELVLLPRLRLPQSPRPHVERSRLWQLLDDAAAGPLTVVRAPAGWGKTVAVGSWAHIRAPRLPIRWLEVDPATGTAGGPTMSDQLRRALAVPTDQPVPTELRLPIEQPRRESARRALVNLAAALAGPVVLVVDDVHRLVAPSDIADLAMLADSATCLRLVLVGRDVPVPLHRSRADGRLTQLGSAALAFTTGECALLLDAFGIAATDDLADRLTRATEGWVAGLRLSAAACAARGGEVADVVDVMVSAGSPARDVSDYLDAEVFAPLSRSVRQFLVRTSVLDRIGQRLGDAVGSGDAVKSGEAVKPGEATGSGDHTTDGADQLADLARWDGFVVADPAGDAWYRYHTMFAAYLRSKIGREVDEDSVELHLRAALWCAANLRAADAVRHAQQAADWTYAACLFVHGPFPAFVDDAFGSFGTLADATPSSVADQCPETAVAVALKHVRAGEPAAAAVRLDWARSQLARLPAVRRRAAAQATDVVELRRAEQAADPDAMLDAARHLLRGCPPTPGELAGAGASTDDRNAQLRALAVLARGRAETWLGRAEPAADHLRTAVRLARASGLPAARTSALGALALVEAMRGRLRAAQEHATEAIEDWTGTGDSGEGRLDDAVPGRREALLASAEVAYQRDDLAAARGLLARMSAGPHVEPQLAALAAAVAARVALADGDVAAARGARRQLAAREDGGWDKCGLAAATVRALDVDLLVSLGNPKAALDACGRDGMLARAEPVVVLAAARAHLAVGEPAAAATLLAPMLRADTGVGIGEVVAACVLDAVCAARAGAGGRATASMARALALAADEGMLGPFLDAGDEVTELFTVHSSLRAAYPDFTRSVFAGRSAQYVRAEAPIGRLVPPARSVSVGPAPGAASVGPLGSLGASSSTDAPSAPERPSHEQVGSYGDGDAGSGRPAGAMPGIVLVGPPAPRRGGGRGESEPPGSEAAGAPARTPTPPAVAAADLGPAGEHLSERERAVLSYLPTMLTTAEIAAEMFLSVNTVKTHLKSIYRKLGVARRRDAVHRARDLRLL